jgi:hypothetical protein
MMTERREQALSMEDVMRITKEVAIGSEPATPDTPEQAAVRASVQRDRTAAESQGYIMDVPSDWAD